MKKRIFGFGSLLNLASVQSTMPDVTHIQPAYIKGFIREFNHWDPLGFTKTQLDVAGIAHCAVDVRMVGDEARLVNGVVFEVSPEYFHDLLVREEGYTLIETTAYEYGSHKPIGKVQVFSSGKNNGRFDFNSVAQQRYLDVCLEGARRFGSDFYNTFLTTTFIDNKNLKQYPQLKNDP